MTNVIFIEKPPILVEAEITTADITKYGWTGDKMSNGEYPYVGAVAVSDRTIPLGSKIIWREKEYTVKDRTAKWVWNKFGLVIDIYSEETEDDMLEFGRKKDVVAIYRD